MFGEPRFGLLPQRAPVFEQEILVTAIGDGPKIG